MGFPGQIALAALLYHPPGLQKRLEKGAQPLKQGKS